MDLAEIIVRRLGIDPVELKAAFQTFLENVAETNREVKAAKVGVGAAWRELDIRTQRIELKLDLLMNELGMDPEGMQPEHLKIALAQEKFNGG